MAEGEGGEKETKDEKTKLVANTYSTSEEGEAGGKNELTEEEREEGGVEGGHKADTATVEVADDKTDTPSSEAVGEEGEGTTSTVDGGAGGSEGVSSAVGAVEGSGGYQKVEFASLYYHAETGYYYDEVCVR